MGKILKNLTSHNMETLRNDLIELSYDQQKLVNGGLDVNPNPSGLGLIGIIISAFQLIVYIVDHKDSIEKGAHDGSSAADTFFSNILKY
jgi:hypothetical protein